MPTRLRKESTHDVSARKGSRLSIAAPKLNAMQLAELLRPFWMDVLQNNLKNVSKFLREHRSRIDFNAVRYTASADGTGLHLCAQHGFTACAKLLLDIGVNVDLQNKVGSTALHVACKFNQEEMVLFLLQLGARMDVPDMRNNVAFDVAPYTLIDKCMLAPQREKLAAEQQEEARLLEIHQAAAGQWEQVTQAKAHASMLLIDWESRAWGEWQALQATNTLDREWSEQVLRSRESLETKRATYTDLQVQLQEEQNQIAQRRETIFREARDRRERAREDVERTLMLTEETHQRWMREQQELWDQFGLVEAALEFPNDADVQQWVLCAMIAMIDEAEAGRVPVNPHAERVTTDIDELLVRDEIVSVLRNILLRFPKWRDLQFSALQCLVRLVRHCTALPIGTRAFDFLSALIKANTMALSRDVLSHFSQDVELAHLGIDVLYRLLQFRGEDGAHSVHFCQNRFSHQLPLQLLRLFETAYPHQEDAESPLVHDIPLSSEALLTARHHASFLLFTLTKYNVRKTLEKDGAVPVVRRLVFELTTSSSDDGSHEVRTSTLRYLLGSLALMHSPPPRNGSNRTSPRPDLPASWSVDDLSRLLGAVRPWLAETRTTESVPNVHRSLAFWTMKLLRNVTEPLEDGVVQLRTWVRTRETFDLLASITLAIRRHRSEEGDDTAVSNIAMVWLELLEDVWLCRYNSDGQLAATSPFVLESLLQLLELEALVTGLGGCSTAFANIAVILKLLALVLSNDKNMRSLVECEYRIDVAMHTILKQLVRSKHESAESAFISEASTLELLAHVLRVYLRFFDYERDRSKSGVNLHERCRAIGICAVLQAFGLPDSENRLAPPLEEATPPPPNANQSDDKPAEACASSKLKAKMQLARAWSQSTGQRNHDPERETLCALARAVRRHAPCHC
ncbi:Intraflagellar transport protein 74 [Phytophthora pseudosyringae]|uniref:Intraflagellar transport protein 74 n=1 Tax=Phytophthora pseudosyringae TaxID=221518 RepID=A0A8T1VE78_9STRA|nr:Intraflagellar transport protein 74 [Phytophthora pseudosyringae]